MPPTIITSNGPVGDDSECQKWGQIFLNIQHFIRRCFLRLRDGRLRTIRRSTTQRRCSFRTLLCSSRSSVSPKPSRRLTLPLVHLFCSLLWFTAERHDSLDGCAKTYRLPP